MRVYSQKKSERGRRAGPALGARGEEEAKAATLSERLLDWADPLAKILKVRLYDLHSLRCRCRDERGRESLVALGAGLAPRPPSSLACAPAYTRLGLPTALEHTRQPTATLPAPSSPAFPSALIIQPPLSDGTHLAR